MEEFAQLGKVEAGVTQRLVSLRLDILLSQRMRPSQALRHRKRRCLQRDPKRQTTLPHLFRKEA